MSGMYPIVICTKCGKLGSTKNERNFAGFLKCRCRSCESDFLYPLSGIYFAVYAILTIKMSAIISILTYGYFKGESEVGFLLFALPIPMVILIYCVNHFIKNTKINRLISAVKNA